MMEVMNGAAALLVEGLLNSLWRGLLLAMLVAAFLRLGRRWSAGTRYLIWWGALVAFPLMPIAYRPPAPLPPPQEAASPGMGDGTQMNSAPAVGTDPAVAVKEAAEWEVSERAAVGATPFVGEPRLDRRPPAGGPRRGRDEGMGARDPRPRKGHPPDEGGPLLRLPAGGWTLGAAALWLLVSLLLLSRIGWSCAHLARLRRSLQPLPEPLKSHLGRLVTRNGVRSVRLGQTEEVSMPMAIAVGRRAVLLPSRLLKELGRRELEQVVLHELAHIRRRDGWTHLVQKIVESFFFFHPAVHWMGRRLQLEREVACDDWVVSALGERRAYAACLTRLAELRARPARLLLAPGATSGRSLFSRRIEMLMDQDRVIGTRPARTALLAGLVGLAALVLALSYMSPLVAFSAEAEAPLRESGVSSETRPTPAPEAASEAVEEALPEGAPEVPAGPPRADSGRDSSPAPDPSPASDPVGRDAPDPAERALKSQRESPEGAPPFVAEPALTRAWKVPGIEDFDFGILPAWEVHVSPVGWGGQPLIPEEELIPFLVEIARSDPDPRVRQAALDGLSRFPGEAAASALLRLYDEIDDVSLKRRILLQLTRSGSTDSRILDRLERVARTETDPQLRRAAIQALGGTERGTRILVALYDGLTDVDARKVVMATLAAGRSEEAAEKLKWIARSDPDPEMRREAVRHLAAGGFAVVAAAPPAPRSQSVAPPEPPPPPEP